MVRALCEAALLKEGPSGIFSSVRWVAKRTVMKTEHRYTIDGVTYDSLDDMPPEVRAKWTSLAPALDAMEKLTAAARTSKLTNVRIKRTTTRTGGESADTITRVLENHDVPPPNGIVSAAPTPRDKRSILFLSALAVVFGLAFLSIFGRVHLTLKYDYRWWVVYAALLAAIAAGMWKIRRKLQRQPALPGITTRSTSLNTVLCGLLAAAAFAAVDLFGGVPILAHYVTARPGEMIVTVTGKADHGQRGCTYRLNIREFTFFADDYLCVSDQAFNEIKVGSKLRIEGKVSRFGIATHRFWLKD